MVWLSLKIDTGIQKRCSGVLPLFSAFEIPVFPAYTGIFPVSGNGFRPPSLMSLRTRITWLRPAKQSKSNPERQHLLDSCLIRAITCNYSCCSELRREATPVRCGAVQRSKETDNGTYCIFHYSIILTPPMIHWFRSTAYHILWPISFVLHDDLNECLIIIMKGWQFEQTSTTALFRRHVVLSFLGEWRRFQSPEATL